MIAMDKAQNINNNIDVPNNTKLELVSGAGFAYLTAISIVLKKTIAVIIIAAIFPNRISFLII